MPPDKKNSSFAIHFAAILISIIAIGYIAVIAENIIIPLVFALLFSILLLPLAKFFEVKLKFGRGAACGIAVLLFIAGIAIIFYAIGSQISNLLQDWPLFRNQLQSSLGNLQKWIAAYISL